jgi:hypothetical protein
MAPCNVPATFVMFLQHSRVLLKLNSWYNIPLMDLHQMIDNYIYCLIFQRYNDDCLNPPSGWYKTHRWYGPNYIPTKEKISNWLGKSRCWVYRYERKFGHEIGYEDLMFFQDLKYFLSKVPQDRVGIELYNIGWRREERTEDGTASKIYPRL